MAEDAQTQKNKDLKLKKRDYTGYDDDEFIAGNEGMKRAVLAKYDEDIDGAKETGFRLGSSAVSSKVTRAMKEEAAVVVNKSLLSIDYASQSVFSPFELDADPLIENMETQDYLKEGDVGFKKPKTKKKRPSRRQQLEPEEADTAMDVDEEKPVVPRARDLDVNFVDDDDLQAALTRARKSNIHRRKKLTPEEIAKKGSSRHVFLCNSNNHVFFSSCPRKSERRG